MIAHVALSIPVSKIFSYSVPGDKYLHLERFLRVSVPFHNKIVTGFITGTNAENNDNLKEINKIIDVFPLIDSSLEKLCEWASHYYITPMGLILKYALPQNLHIEKCLAVKAADDDTAFLDGLSFKDACNTSDRDTIRNYYHQGLLSLHDIFTGKPFMPLTSENHTSNSPENILYISNIEKRLAFYSDSISHHLDRGGNVLMLLPDYHTSGAYFYRIFKETFKERVFWYGSATRQKSKLEAYFRARSEKGLLFLGNKSCAFLPVAGLSLIVAERPEEDEYKNEEGFKFNAISTVQQRAEIENIPIVFGSAAPPLKLYKDANENKLRIIKDAWLKNKKFNELPVEKDFRAKGVPLEEVLKITKDALEKNKSIAIYTPRKDYGSFMRCLNCKTMIACPECEGAMSYQKQDKTLICAGCGKTISYTQECPSCKSSLIHPTHIGVEYLEEVIAASLKNPAIITITGDTLKNGIKILKEYIGKPVIIIGTQSLAKLYGINIDKLVLVGWEELFRVAGFRSNEKLFQIFTNLIDALKPEETSIVIGRKHHFDIPGLFDMDKFYMDELQRRKQAEYPPCVRIFLVEVDRKSEAAGKRILDNVEHVFARDNLTQYAIGPLIYKNKRGFRWRMILKGNEDVFYKSLMSLYDLTGVRIEADPLNV